jgi:mono/diheme cytochrome c family protein
LTGCIVLMCKERLWVKWVGCVAAALGWFSVLAVAAVEGEGRVSFSRDLQPIFQARCQGCHQPAKAKGGYVMTSFAGLMQAGDSGEVPVVAGDAMGSHLLRQY